MEEPSKLTIKQKLFVEQYIFDWNATRAYNEIYKPKNLVVAATNGTRMLRNAQIQNYIIEAQKDLERLSGISRLKVLSELNKLAFSSIAHLHNSWIERKEFDQLTEDQKACISEISSQVKKITIDEQLVDVEYVKIKLYDKNKALDSIKQMLGFNAAEKIDLNFERDKKRVASLFPTPEEFNDNRE
jgi:phage terminase small subunit